MKYGIKFCAKSIWKHIISCLYIKVYIDISENTCKPLLFAFLRQTDFSLISSGLFLCKT